MTPQNRTVLQTRTNHDEPFRSGTAGIRESERGRSLVSTLHSERARLDSARSIRATAGPLGKPGAL